MPVLYGFLIETGDVSVEILLAGYARGHFGLLAVRLLERPPRRLPLIAIVVDHHC